MRNMNRGWERVGRLEEGKGGRGEGERMEEGMGGRMEDCFTICLNRGGHGGRGMGLKEAQSRMNVLQQYINMYVMQKMAMNDECCRERHNLTECATVMVLRIAKLTPIVRLGNRTYRGVLQKCLINCMFYYNRELSCRRFSHLLCAFI